MGLCIFKKISMENIRGMQICCLRCDIQGIQNFCVKIYENPPFPLPHTLYELIDRSLNIYIYHLVDMNTSILLVESRVILNRIKVLSLKTSLSAHSRQKRSRRSAHDMFGARVYQRRSLKRVIRSHITCLIMVIRKILI